ncbi:hypothetical protein FSP39_011919 [Pinctada imbricata]|uniref:Nacre protein n=1 Tax=Pinctada imbricata TaxID=66713 RepID=A0AA88YIA2_PINIB|nr:hypothetical protein FSP39_011919 [Pinctada imbricata]
MFLQMVQAGAMSLFILVLVATITTVYSCRHQDTGYNDDGKGNMVYFDRHVLRCGNRGMRWFKLDRGSQTIRFEYECCNLPTKVRSREFQTTFTYEKGGNLVYLDRQRVSCGTKGILSGFNMQRNPRRDHIRFNVICNDYNRLNCQRTQYTHFNDDGKGKSFYLDRHRVQCNNGYFLNNFRLKRNGRHNKIRMEFKCCRPT